MTHRIEWAIEVGCPPSATFSCDAPVGAECRTWCAVGCDEVCPGPKEHEQADTGRCYVIEYLQNSGTADELYAGEDTALRSGPISTSWEGEGYEWEYAVPVVDRRDLRADLERIAGQYLIPEEGGYLYRQQIAAQQAERLVAMMLPYVDAYAWRNP